MPMDAFVIKSRSHLYGHGSNVFVFRDREDARKVRDNASWGSLRALNRTVHALERRKEGTKLVKPARVVAVDLAALHRRTVDNRLAVNLVELVIEEDAKLLLVSSVETGQQPPPPLEDVRRHIERLFLISSK